MKVIGALLSLGIWIHKCMRFLELQVSKKIIKNSQKITRYELVCNVDYIFADSQFYVALSRAIDPKRLQINYLRRVISVSDSDKSFYSESKMVELD